MKFALLDNRYQNTEIFYKSINIRNGGSNIWRAKMRINTEFG